MAAVGAAEIAGYPNVAADVGAGMCQANGRIFPAELCGQAPVVVDMDEHRRSPRQRVLKTGKILYGGGSIAIDCTIRNLSETGARLQVPTSVAIPDRFEFVETASRKQRAATVMWRKGELMGIRFDT